MIRLRSKRRHQQSRAWTTKGLTRRSTRTSRMRGLTPDAAGRRLASFVRPRNSISQPPRWPGSRCDCWHRYWPALAGPRFIRTNNRGLIVRVDELSAALRFGLGHTRVRAFRRRVASACLCRRVVHPYSGLSIAGPSVRGLRVAPFASSLVCGPATRGRGPFPFCAQSRILVACAATSIACARGLTRRSTRTSRVRGLRPPQRAAG